MERPRCEKSRAKARPLQRLGEVEGGGAGDSGVLAVFGEEHGDFGEALVDAPVAELFADTGEERAHELGYATAENENIGLEEVDYVADPNRQKVRGFAEHLGGERVILAERFGYRFRGDGVHMAVS